MTKLRAEDDIKRFVIVHKTLHGYVHELVLENLWRYKVKGGFHSEYTGRDGDIIEITRFDGKDDYWYEVFADEIVELP